MANCQSAEKKQALLRMQERKWGVMCHYLSKIQNNPQTINNEGVGETSWEQMVNEFDVESFAKQLHELGAKYILFTIMQGDRYMIAPNETYDKLMGLKAGEACSRRDLPLELYEALKKYDIDLYLYYTSDGPYLDEELGPKMGWHIREKEKLNDRFLRNWASVLKEYAERYKGKAKAWWVDGAYEYFGFNDENLSYYAEALQSADENYLITFNDGYAVNMLWVKDNEWKADRYDRNATGEQATDVSLRKYSKHEDFTAGEALDFTIYPTSETQDGSLWHILSPLSGGDGINCEWGGAFVKYTKEYMCNYFRRVWEKKGIITVDMGVTRSGKFFDEQVSFMKEVMQELNKK